MKNYQFKQHGTQFGHGSMKGDIVQLTDERAKPLLDNDVIVEVTTEEASDLPEDLPGRQYLADFSVDDLERMDAEMLQDIKGIGKATANAIVEYFEEQK